MLFIGIVLYYYAACLLIVGAEKNNAIHYDSFRGCPMSAAQYKDSVKKNTTFWCVNDVLPCDPKEGRRLDGTCNNLKHPSRGASHTPFYRILPAVFNTDDGGYEPRKASDGSPLPLARHLRTSLIPEGKVPDQTFTQLVTHILVFHTADLVSLQDTVNYILWTTYCCLPKGKTDPVCVPNEVPANDPVHRFSGIRCLNMTRPQTFQSSGCIKNGTTPERIVSTTPTLDLSNIYGNTMNSLLKRGRLFQMGLLKTEIENGRVWPPSTKTNVNLCLQNQKPAEKRCHATPEDGPNSLLGINLFSIWFWRNHNRIATELAAINPCWRDDKLFDTARDINIATSAQIMYYELFPLLMGKNNLLRDSVISSSPGFRDIYNDQILPQLALEYTFASRWFHNMQEGSLKMYDKDGYYLRQQPIVNLTLRTGFLAIDDNIDDITQGSFRQPCANSDYIVDPEISEVGLGSLQLATDIITNDFAKNRYFGFQPFLKYRKFFYGHDKLDDVFEPERLELLKDNYKSLKDIDLLAGMWLEKHVQGGYIPETLYSIMTEQLVRTVVSDRHWYERRNRPHAFTSDQLMEIRKASVSKILCDVGDKVTKIQPKGFLRPGHGNQLSDCGDLPGIDLTAWEDRSCTKRGNGRHR